MNQDEKNREERAGSRGLLAWMKDLLRKYSRDIEEIPADPAPEVVTTLIEIASGEREGPEKGGGPEAEGAPEGREQQGGGEKTGNGDEAENEEAAYEDPGEKRGCSYAMKRNIVASLQEIRRFAEEHDLASAMVKALLTMLAEMAIEALRGKVSGTVLAILLNALNYEKDKEAAYRQGELDGRNAKIVAEYFPEEDDGLPHLKGGSGREVKSPDIFSVAKEANS